MIKYSSFKAVSSNFFAISKVSSFTPSLFNTSSAAFLITFARGSKFLYTRCPKPIKRKLSSLSFALSTHFCVLPPSCLICSNISITAWFAPPCNGPQRAATPAAMLEYKLACEEPTIFTVEVEQFCS